MEKFGEKAAQWRKAQKMNPLSRLASPTRKFNLARYWNPWEAAMHLNH